MDKYAALRKKYNDAGVSIDIVKFGLGPDMTDEEVDYCFNVAKALGCKAITCEPPVSETKRLGKFADKHQIRLGYHNHSNATSVESFCRPGAWEQAFFYSDWNGANVDIGHFCAGNSMSPADFIRSYHDRITNLHLKDRKFDQGPNMPWGEGDTPIRQILQMMKAEKYRFMATIELGVSSPGRFGRDGRACQVRRILQGGVGIDGQSSRRSINRRKLTLNQMTRTLPSP